MRTLLERALPGLSTGQYAQFCAYYALLIEWNARMNLTALTEPEDVAYKHFADSVLPQALIPQQARLIDVGTGAGFPGIPLKIIRPDIRLTLLDSLGKRVAFLEAVCAELGFTDVACIHARAEEAARTEALRGHFDVATSRAVAPAAALVEYTVPFLRVGGKSLMYKGPQAQVEFEAAQSALKTLGAVGEVLSFEAPWGERNVLAVTKRKPTPAVYPRRPGESRRNPL